MGGGATQGIHQYFIILLIRGKFTSVFPTTCFINLWNITAYLRWKISILTFLFHWILGNGNLLLVIRRFVLLPLSYLGHCFIRTVLQISIAFDLTKSSPDVIFMNPSLTWLHLYKYPKQNWISHLWTLMVY